MNANSIISLLQDKLPKDFTLLKMLENRLGTLDEKRLDELAQKIPLLNLKLPIFAFWVRSFIFAAFDINRFMTGQIQLKAQVIQRQTPIHSQLYNKANLACWTLKLAIFLAHAVLFIVITGATLDAVTNVINEYLQNAIRSIRVNNFIVGILGVVATI